MSKAFEVTLWEKVTYTMTVFAEDEDEAYEAAQEAVSEGGCEGVSQGYYAMTSHEIEEKEV
ncbi:MAG: hypothetical protein LPK02_07250 [Rhodobacterales bacterium]|nr:hypothetical protein [Rhodobacterales bacterium]